MTIREEGVLGVKGAALLHLLAGIQHSGTSDLRNVEYSLCAERVHTHIHPCMEIPRGIARATENGVQLFNETRISETRVLFTAYCWKQR